MKTNNNEVNNEAPDDTVKEDEVKSSDEQENEKFGTISCGLKLVWSKSYTNYIDYHNKCENEPQKLRMASNILIALTGAFEAYKNMNQKQFEEIVKSFTSSERIDSVIK